MGHIIGLVHEARIKDGCEFSLEARETFVKIGDILSCNPALLLGEVEAALEKLSENYVSSKISERVRLKVPGESGTLWELLQKQSQDLNLPLVATGTSSVTQYAVMQRGDVLSVYCPRLEMLLDRLPGSQSDRFPNLELIETEDETVYFDTRKEGNSWWASPVQVYLELMGGDKRDREIAEQVKSFILKNLQPVQK